MLALLNQFDDLLNDELFQARRSKAVFTPAVDIVETKGGYRLAADLPGFRPEDIEISAENGNLIISGERKMEVAEEKDGYRHRERAYGRFRRTFSLPKGVDVDAIRANVENGVLVLSIPKPVAEIPRKIKVAAQPTSVDSKAPALSE
jgi:HSP20 family protein